MAHPRVMFASYHCYHDPASGAASSTRDLLIALATREWRCGAFTGPVLDDTAATPIGSALRSYPGVRTNSEVAGATGFAVHSVDDPSGFPATVFVPDPPTPAKAPSSEEAAGFLTVLAETMRRFRPDVVLTYGGDPASRGVRSLARRAGAKVAFRLHNFAYSDPTSFTDCDAITVPSAFSRDHHRTALGLNCTVVPPVIEPSRVLVDRPDRGRFVTFVNPEPNKGVFWFARMAEVLGRSRPDIPLLLVKGRGRADGLAGCGVDLRNVTSLHRLANTPDPRRFYRVTRLALVPSVWRESFGRRGGIDVQWHPGDRQRPRGAPGSDRVRRTVFADPDTQSPPKRGRRRLERKLPRGSKPFLPFGTIRCGTPRRPPRPRWRLVRGTRRSSSRSGKHF